MTMILLVDDNKRNRFMLENLLKEEDYEVALADHEAEVLHAGSKKSFRSDINGQYDAGHGWFSPVPEEESE